MVCGRCLNTLKNILAEHNIVYTDLQLGRVELARPLNPTQLNDLAKTLQQHGFELLQNADQKLIAQIKQAVLEFIDEPLNRENLSQYLSKNLGKEYSALSKLFSQIEGRTLEHYFIALRVEKAKEYITYNELSFSEISDKLNFSSVAHLSAQFKKVTGMTPTAFKQLGASARIGLEKV
jgi:AraC-like DNA-binding protein